MLGSLDVEWVLKIEQVPEEAVEAPDDVLELSGGRPPHSVDGVEPEEGEADVALLVDVGVPEAGEALDDGRAEVVVLGDADAELELAALPEALVGDDAEGELVEGVGVVEADLEWNQIIRFTLQGQ